MKRILLVENDAGKTIYKKKESQNLTENCSKEVSNDFLESKISSNFEPILIDCILQKADVENKNGRIYPRALLEREIKKYTEQIELNNAFGNCDHPDDSVVSLKENPHRITKIWWVDNVVYGTLELIVSEGYRKYGIISCSGDDICNKIHNYNATIGISSRGIGSLKEIGSKKYVQDDFELICWDLVQSPSTFNAYLFNDNEDIITQTTKAYHGDVMDKEESDINMFDFNRFGIGENKKTNLDKFKKFLKS